MAILKVARLGHPLLRERALELQAEEIRSESFQDFVDDLVATMHEYDGAGLAAPQVHVLRRVLVMEVRNNPRYPDAPPIPLTVLVNPVIEALTEEEIEVWEGCLSVPGIRGKVPRLARIRLRALDRHGEEIDQVFEGFPAAVVQHECDHLDGRVFVDRVRDTRSLAFHDELRRYGPLA